jgi:type IV secretory pathway TrbF-like protein
MFTQAQQTGADQILALARRVAAELGPAAGRSLRVVGWRGSGGKMDWEYVVEVDGTGCALEVGESDLLTFPDDDQVRTQIEERIRYQMRSAMDMVRSPDP